MLKTKGDPLGRVHSFVRDVWQAAALDALVIPPNAKGQKHVLTDPAGLEEVNPFQPLMLMNIAGVIPAVLEEHKDGRVGVLLRPCEMRALNEVAGRGAIQILRQGLDKLDLPAQGGAERLLTLCVDCLGTFPEDEFAWRAARKGSEKGLSGEALQFAPQGGISAYRYRAACQMCISPGASNADVNIGILGLPVRQTVLVEVKDGGLDWPTLTGGAADAALVEKRRRAVAKLDERHARRRERIMSGLDKSLPMDVDSLLEQFENCGACQTCMDNCPICAIHYPRRDGSGRFAKDEIANWLASCAGCGMCEQSCPQHLPLGIIFTQVKQQLQRALAI